jgi:hypothetical protein
LKKLFGIWYLVFFTTSSILNAKLDRRIEKRKPEAATSGLPKVSANKPETKPNST